MFFFKVNAFCDLFKKSLLVPRSRIKSSLSYRNATDLCLHLDQKVTWKYWLYIVWGWSQDSFLCRSEYTIWRSPSYWKDYPFLIALQCKHCHKSNYKSNADLHVWVSFWSSVSIDQTVYILESTSYSLISIFSFFQGPSVFFDYC